MPPSELRAAEVVLGLTGSPDGDMKDPAARAAALARAGLSGLPAYFLKQVHGAHVVRVGPSTPLEPAPEADGWITDCPDRALCVFVADCLPIFLWDDAGRAVGVFHSGWKGAAAGMPREAVASFQRFFGVSAADLHARVGAHVGPCCYRVGPELEPRFRAESFRRTDAGLFLDLGAEARAQLVESGVPAARVEVDASCTSCEPERFFSFRRDKQDCRMMAYAALRS